MALSEVTGEFLAGDGIKLFYRAWLPRGDVKRGVLLFHRGHEHSARWEETVRKLAMEGMEGVGFFGWDQRGHGQSPGVRGDAESVAAVEKDAELFVQHVTRVHRVRVEDMAVVAHSVGAVVAGAWVHDYAPPIRGMVMVAPALRVKLYVPFAIPALRMKQKFFKSSTVKSYVKSTMLTHDAEQAAAYQKDAAIFRQISVRMLLDLHDAGTRLMKDAGAITTPTLVVGAGDDWVVDNKAQRIFYERLSSQVKQFEVMEGFYHGMFHERGREKLVERVRGFLQECFSREPNRETLAAADLGGHTRTEYDLLRLPGAMKWGVARGFMKSVGKLSDGIRLGHRAGFDSGVMLDYVYENKARGWLGVGAVIDRNYLNSIGWRGIRVRRENLERMLRETILRVQGEGKPVRILDIAAGAGRYVLEVMKGMREVEMSAVLRDYQEVNLEAARKKAAELGVGNVSVENGDAFDKAGLARISPRPTIAIVSGLYELFPENDGLRKSLAGLAAAVEPGGYLLYTCQPWHPQVEFIARVLRNREGKLWIMRRRTQGEMDELVRQAGFEKVEQAIDRWGIFTVSLARPRAKWN